MFTILGQETGSYPHGESWEGKSKCHNYFRVITIVRVILTIWEPGTGFSKFCEVLCISLNRRFENAKLVTK